MKETYRNALYNIIQEVGNEFCWNRCSKPEIGDIVKLSSIKASEYTVSEVIDTRSDGNECLLKSLIEPDNDLCWHSNCGYSVYDKRYGDWLMKWNDSQFEFDHFIRVTIFGDKGYHLNGPSKKEHVEFKDDIAYFDFEPNVHGMYEINIPNFSFKREFKDWRNTTEEEILSILEECSEEFDYFLSQGGSY